MWRAAVVEDRSVWCVREKPDIAEHIFNSFQYQLQPYMVRVASHRLACEFPAGFVAFLIGSCVCYVVVVVMKGFLSTLCLLFVF